MRIAGLFAGIGGIEVGLEGAGHSTEFLCDIDPCAQAVLRHRFPGVPVESDIRKIRCLPKNVELLTAAAPPPPPDPFPPCIATPPTTS
ncbi:MAG TPA: DNA cytosine methyltransferase [bacterium]|nr:DNA cytosine methyltransferase [bacterium]